MMMTNEQLEQRIAALQREINALYKENDELRQERDELRQERDELQNTNAELMAESIAIRSRFVLQYDDKEKQRIGNVFDGLSKASMFSMLAVIQFAQMAREQYKDDKRELAKYLRYMRELTERQEDMAWGQEFIALMEESEHWNDKQLLDLKRQSLSLSPNDLKAILAESYDLANWRGRIVSHINFALDFLLVGSDDALKKVMAILKECEQRHDHMPTIESVSRLALEWYVDKFQFSGAPTKYPTIADHIGMGYKVHQSKLTPKQYAVRTRGQQISEKQAWRWVSCYRALLDFQKSRGDELRQRAVEG